MTTPYISIIFVNRNDGYGDNQVARITKFIDYYSYYDKKYSGLFEFVICDWNPPDERKSLKDQYEWDKLSRVVHLVVPKAIHSELCPDNSRPILDYTGRNVCIRAASAPFILVINQDIFVSASIFDFLAQKKLSPKYFYRTDRCDFDCDYNKEFECWDEFEEHAKKNVIMRHMRVQSPLDKMSLSIPKNRFDDIHTVKSSFEYQTDGVIYSDFYNYVTKPFVKIKNLLMKQDPKQPPPYTSFFLHTNASGDFLLAPKKAFYDVHGFVETHFFYMHLDSYMCMQLFAAGYKQAILAAPHVAFHSDHSRTDREGRSESMSYKEHADIWSDICLGRRPYKINQDDWGLKDLNLALQL